MSLSEKIGVVKNNFSRNIDYFLATGTFAAASATDYYITLARLITKEIKEINPLYNLYINSFGPEKGLLIQKIILGSVVLASSKCIDIEYKEGKIRVKAEHLLYPGALLTTGVSLSWLLQKYMS